MKSKKQTRSQNVSWIHMLSLLFLHHLLVLVQLLIPSLANQAADISLSLKQLQKLFVSFFFKNLGRCFFGEGSFITFNKLDKENYFGKSKCFMANAAVKRGPIGYMNVYIFSNPSSKQVKFPCSSLWFSSCSTWRPPWLPSSPEKNK